LTQQNANSSSGSSANTINTSIQVQGKYQGRVPDRHDTGSAPNLTFEPNRIRWKPKMELKNLKSFVAVAEQLSFVRSAKLLHLSQSALTEQIQRLEEELGVQLFLRDRRTVNLTEASYSSRKPELL
jgi:hypothetical protein